jgi:hypothetical protein
VRADGPDGPDGVYPVETDQHVEYADVTRVAGCALTTSRPRTHRSMIAARPPVFAPRFRPLVAGDMITVWVESNNHDRLELAYSDIAAAK